MVAGAEQLAKVLAEIDTMTIAVSGGVDSMTLACFAHRQLGRERVRMVLEGDAYDGAVVLVSHDSHLVGAVCDRLWLVADRGCREYEDDVSAYRRSLLDGGKSPARREKPSGGNRKDERRARAEVRAGASGLKRKVERAEKIIARLTAALDEVKAGLVEPVLYEEGNRDRLIELQTRYSELERDIERAEEAWMTASHELESVA